MLRICAYGELLARNHQSSYLSTAFSMFSEGKIKMPKTT